MDHQRRRIPGRRDSSVTEHQHLKIEYIASITHLQLLTSLPRSSPRTIVGPRRAQDGSRAVRGVISADSDGAENLNDKRYRT